MPVPSAPDARWSGTQKEAAIVERGRSARCPPAADLRDHRVFSANASPTRSASEDVFACATAGPRLQARPAVPRLPLRSATRCPRGSVTRNRLVA